MIAADVQKQVADVEAELLTTTTRGTYMVQTYGADWTKWPAGIWKTVFQNLETIKTAIATLGQAAWTVTVSGTATVGQTIIFTAKG